MPIKLQKQNDVFILTPDQDGITDQAFEELIAPPGLSLRNAYSETAKAVIFDLRDVDFIDSHGIGLIVGVRTCLHENCVFICCGLSAHVRNLMMVTHLDDLAKIYDDLDQALASL
jgi:anti-anti-sigma factor